jgi:hypothetical protein
MEFAKSVMHETFLSLLRDHANAESQSRSSRFPLLLELLDY